MALMVAQTESAAGYMLRMLSHLSEVYPVAAGAFQGSLALVRPNQGDFGSARALLTRAEGQLRGQCAFEFAPAAGC